MNVTGLKSIPQVAEVRWLFLQCETNKYRTTPKHGALNGTAVAVSGAVSLSPLATGPSGLHALKVNGREGFFCTSWVFTGLAEVSLLVAGTEPMLPAK